MARMPCDFPPAVVFATSTSSRFVNLKLIKFSFNFQVYKRTEFNKTIIPFALFGYEIGYSQLGPRWLLTISYPTRAHGIIVKHCRFIWLKGSMTLIRAETERYDIVGFSKVTSKSLTSGQVLRSQMN